MAEQKNEKTALFAAGAAAIAAAVALLRSGRVSAAGPVLDEATMNLLVAMARNTGLIAEDLDKLLNDLPGLLKLAGGVVPNTITINNTGLVCTLANTAYVLPEMEVPDDMSLVIKSWPTNPVGSLIYVSYSAGGAININQVWPLVPNESIAYRVKNANELWVSATVALSRVALTCERR